MMRFHCPHCRHILEVAPFTEAFLCPACEQWCRIPAPDEFELEKDEAHEVVEAPPVIAVPPRPLPAPRLALVDQEEEILDVVAVPQGMPPMRRDAITERRPGEPPLRFQDEEVEDVQLEIVEDGETRRRRRRRRRRRSGGSINIDYWISPSLILILIGAPGALIFTLLSFLIHPGAGFGCLLMMGGGIWFTAIALEDSLVTALLVVCHRSNLG